MPEELGAASQEPHSAPACRWLKCFTLHQPACSPQVKGALWSPVSPTANDSQSYLVAYSQEMAEELGLNPEDISNQQFADVFAGNAPVPNSTTPTYAMRYGGHQFGSWAGNTPSLQYGLSSHPCQRLCMIAVKGSREHAMQANACVSTQCS